MLKGIDVSSHNGDINWNEVKHNIDFAIIRLGYGDNINSQDDRCFLQNVNGCINNNIPFGVYIYSYATNLGGNASIQSEIEHTKRQLSKISKKPFCVYIDMEDNSTIKLGKTLLTDFALEFCKQITKAGYKAGVYANQNWYQNYLNPSTIASYGYSIWCAKYSSENPRISSNYDIWQYSDSGKIAGIVGNVDMNYMLKDIRQNNTKPVNTAVNIYYAVKTEKYGWLSEVKNLEDYAGYKNDKVIGIKMRVDKGSIRYRVTTVTGKQLGWVTGCNVSDYKNGWAGLNNGEAISLIEAEYLTPPDIKQISGYKFLYYKVNEYPYQIDLIKDKEKHLDGYAGKKGVACTKFQAYIK